MSTIVYLSNQQVQVIIGSMGKNSISVKQVYQEEAPEGSIINGMIMDMETFIGFMKSFWSKYKFSDKEVYLVINSSKFVGKNLDLPKMNERKTIEFIDREFKDMGRDDDFVYSYIQLSSHDKRNNRIYAEGIDPDFIKDYLDLFYEVGVKVKGLYSGEGTLINMVSKTVAKAHQTFVTVFIDSISLTTVLWVNGEFSYYNTSRCFHEQGTIEHAEDVARTVSQVSQFMQAHQMESKLECVIIAGLENNDVEIYSDQIHELGILANVEAFRQSYINTIADMHEFTHAASGLFQNVKWQNSLLHYQTFKKKDSRIDDKTKTTIAIILLIFFAMILILVSLLFIRETKKKKLMDLNDYNNSPLVIDQITQYDMYSNRNHFLNNQFSSIENISKNLDTYPRGNDIVYNEILSLAEGYAELTFDTFDAQEGTISMIAKASDVDKINQFIKRLNENDVFTNVNYSGYAFNEYDNMWDIHVTCVLSESAGRKDGNR